jgi:hypothetical protein
MTPTGKVFAMIRMQRKAIATLYFIITVII